MTNKKKYPPKMRIVTGKYKRPDHVSVSDERVEVIAANFDGNQASVLSHLKLAADRVAKLDRDTLKSIHIEVRITAQKEPDNIVHVNFGGGSESAF